MGTVSKRINEAFLTEYMELDKICCEKFGVSTGGATEYINRLTSARFAPCRDVGAFQKNGKNIKKNWKRLLTNPAAHDIIILTTEQKG